MTLCILAKKKKKLIKIQQQQLKFIPHNDDGFVHEKLTSFENVKKSELEFVLFLWFSDFVGTSMWLIAEKMTKKYIHIIQHYWFAIWKKMLLIRWNSYQCSRIWFHWEKSISQSIEQNVHSIEHTVFQTSWITHYFNKFEEMTSIKPIEIYTHERNENIIIIR